ncbi:hypothetical protein [Pseudoteredinibacter isoporae]|uniref:Uncharacterized protein n=1 Tax=Pseudoteredinibacter isoporae TaxID=570281 RepID=A0A7X0JPT9_9GAMM|nr:hypothetical protein [Pseudoteredinibacter isoporae]MBB6520040.1 hypothetical protein [Pseudoteredinibacter isoporae]NHO85612.1 hypothetical protein [Pseudoteredinibacter isoporae]NIB25936.1 hypothetical protein [Pseudoteredinibacter isoporae]
MMTVRLLMALLLSLLIAVPTVQGAEQNTQDKEKVSTKEKPESDIIKKKPQSTESDKGPKTNKDNIDWGYWNKKPGKDGKQYGVGIKGKLEEQLNSLDESSLVDDPSGVLLDEEMENDI